MQRLQVRQAETERGAAVDTTAESHSMPFVVCAAAASGEEYELLQKLNQHAAKKVSATHALARHPVRHPVLSADASPLCAWVWRCKYEHMADQAIKLVSAINTVNATQASLETFFAQIDQLETNVSDSTQHTATAAGAAAASAR